MEDQSQPNPCVYLYMWGMYIMFIFHFQVTSYDPTDAMDKVLTHFSWFEIKGKWLYYSCSIYAALRLCYFTRQFKISLCNVKFVKSVSSVRYQDTRSYVCAVLFFINITNNIQVKNILQWS